MPLLNALSSPTCTKAMMTSTPTFRTAAEPSDDTSNKLVFLRDENNTLRTKCSELEDAYSRLRARCFTLEATSGSGHTGNSSSHDHSNGYGRNINHCNYHFSTQSSYPDYRAYTACRPSTTNPRTRGTNPRVTKENQDLISSLYQRNDVLQRDYSALRHKHQNVLSNNGRLKKEIQTLRLRTTGFSSASSRSRTSMFPTSTSSFATGRDKKQFTHNEKEASTPTNTRPDAHELIQELQARLDQAETRAKLGDSWYDNNEHKSQESVVKELAEATSKLHSMKEKYGKLESTCNECLDKLEETKSELRMTRRERDRAEGEVTELRRQNASLEEKITRLCCDAPFPNTCIFTSQDTNAAALDSSPIKESDDELISREINISSKDALDTCSDPSPIKTVDETNENTSSDERDEVDFDEYGDDDFE